VIYTLKDIKYAQIERKGVEILLFVIILLIVSNSENEGIYTSPLISTWGKLK